MNSAAVRRIKDVTPADGQMNLLLKKRKDKRGTYRTYLTINNIEDVVGYSHGSYELMKEIDPRTKKMALYLSLRPDLV